MAGQTVAGDAKHHRVQGQKLRVQLAELLAFQRAAGGIVPGVEIQHCPPPRQIGKLHGLIAGRGDAEIRNRLSDAHAHPGLSLDRLQHRIQIPVSYTHLDVYKRQPDLGLGRIAPANRLGFGWFYPLAAAASLPVRRPALLSGRFSHAQTINPHPDSTDRFRLGAARLVGRFAVAALAGSRRLGPLRYRTAARTGPGSRFLARTIRTLSLIHI